MVLNEQIIDRRAGSPAVLAPGGASTGERAAIESLRVQIARLERQLSGIVAAGFPHVGVHGGERSSTPHLLTLGELEQTRDRLVQRVHDAQQRTLTRAEFERRSRA
ncbi:MAG TPA: hypothetical protein VID70_04670, partial [Solirubrobacteraceae bacterium]